MVVKNLAQLKKALAVGAKYEVLEHFTHPEYKGQKRVVQKVQTNGVYSGIADEPDCKFSMLNHGKGCWTGFEKASSWVFSTDGSITLLNPRTGEKVMVIRLLA